MYNPPPPPGRLHSEGQFNRGFFALRVWVAYIWRGLYMEGLIFGILRYIAVWVVHSKLLAWISLFHIKKVLVWL